MTMTKTYTPREFVDAIIEDFPDHAAGTRPVHVSGIGVEGFFRASDAAAAYCTAEHFQGEDVDVIVRFSNGSGSPTRRDEVNDVRGMATRFLLKEHAPCDLIAMTLGEFFAPNPDEFMAFTKAATPVAPQRESAWNKFKDMLRLELPLPDPYAGQQYDSGPGTLAFANAHAYARQAVVDSAGLGAPSSYARAAYHGCNTFIAIAPDGHRRYVRFSWQPVAGVRKNADPSKGPAYLNAELKRRIERWPPRFVLNMTIGEDGDALHDPSIPWPRRRRKISMGMLYLTKIAEDQDKFAKNIAFNPGRLTPGLERDPEDEILNLRWRAYEVSREMRSGTACPFAKGDTPPEREDAS